MTMRGVGVVVVLSFRRAVDDPDRFFRSLDVGAWLGLTPRRWRSVKSDIAGRITKAGMRANARCFSRLSPPFLAVSASCLHSSPEAFGARREPA